MYKNAGIKSKKEAAQRLIDGEVFYSPISQSEIKFVPSRTQPFRYVESRKFVDNCLDMAWDTFADWQVKVDWRENIGEGVLCWVWDDDSEKRKRIAVVVAYHKYRAIPERFVTDKVGSWANAKPLTPEEAKKFIFGEHRS
jgi:hypothetical protein